MFNALQIQEKLISLIHSVSYAQAHRLDEKFFNRKRLLSFAILVSLILQKISKSLQIEANLLGDFLKQSPVSKQALSKARYKIGISAFQELHERTLAMHYCKNQERLWKGYRVFGGDGSTLQLPKRGDIPDFFGDHFKRTCLAKVMQYTELTSDLIVAADLKPYKVSEEAMAKQMLPHLVEKMRSFGHTKQIYVYDRGFPSHAFGQRHINLGVDFLYRVQKSYNPKIQEYISKNEEGEFDLKLCRGAISYTVRVIVRYLASGQALVLLTSLFDRELFSTEDLIKLYQMRWRCEESYKFQKVILQMDNTSSRNYHGIAQEFWATVLLATLMGISFNEEDDAYTKERPEENTKANRSVIFGSLMPKYLGVLMLEIPLEEFNEKFRKLCKRHRVPIKPHRNYPRLSVDTRKTRHCYRRII